MIVTISEVKRANEVWIKHFQDSGIWYSKNWEKVGIHHKETYHACSQQNGPDFYDVPDDLGNCIKQLSSPHGEILLKAMIARNKSTLGSKK